MKLTVNGVSREVKVAPLKRLLDLLRCGLLDIKPIRPRVYPLAALPEAMDAAAEAGLAGIAGGIEAEVVRYDVLLEHVVGVQADVSGLGAPDRGR